MLYIMLYMLHTGIGFEIAMNSYFHDIIPAVKYFFSKNI